MAGETTLSITGNLTADPELRFTGSGVGVVSFTVASTARKYDKGTEKWEDQPAVFMRCNAWRQLAENISESMKRGSRVVVTGTLKQRSFETKEGEKRSVMELEVEDIGLSVKFHPARTMAPERSSQREEPRGGGGWGGGTTSQRPATDDPWGHAPPARVGGFNDEPPF